MTSGAHPWGPRGEKYGNARRRNWRPHTVERVSNHPTSAVPTAAATVTPRIQTMLVNHSVDQSTAIAASRASFLELRPRA